MFLSFFKLNFCACKKPILEFKGLFISATSHDFLPYASSYCEGESLVPFGTLLKALGSALSFPIKPNVPFVEFASSESKKS